MRTLSFLIVTQFIYSTTSHDIKGFNDAILYDFNWLGPETENLQALSELTDHEEMTVMSSNYERYRCFLPDITKKPEDPRRRYEGPSALELLSPLFSQNTCSYRLDSYWTYEVCHGRFIRQYHEDREGKIVKLQEFFLGTWKKGQFERLLEEYRKYPEEMEGQVPVKKIDGVNLPYFEVVMGNGTMCDLKPNTPRETKVLYVCYVHGKHEIFSFKEVATCQYELVILSALLCEHPKYKPQENVEHTVHCVGVNGAPKEPKNLKTLLYDSESLYNPMRFQVLPSVDELYNNDFKKFSGGQLFDSEEANWKKIDSEVKPGDMSPVESFLSGQSCLTGGSTYWRYEFCYGKSVKQYHENKDGTITSINLGYFDKEKHLEWIKQNPSKRPKELEKRNKISHLYTGGTVCDKTGKPRQTEVKLFCVPIRTAVTLYMVEPKPCEYILGVESPLICNIINSVDENGLVEEGFVGDDSNVDETDKLQGIIKG